MAKPALARYNYSKEVLEIDKKETPSALSLSPNAEIIKNSIGEFCEATDFGLDTGIAAVMIGAEGKKRGELVFIDKKYNKIPIFCLRPDLSVISVEFRLLSTFKWAYALPLDTDNKATQLFIVGERLDQIIRPMVILDETMIIFVDEAAVGRFGITAIQKTLSLRLS